MAAPAAPASPRRSPRAACRAPQPRPAVRRHRSAGRCSPSRPTWSSGSGSRRSPAAPPSRSTCGTPTCATHCAATRTPWRRWSPATAATPRPRPGGSTGGASRSTTSPRWRSRPCCWPCGGSTPSSRKPFLAFAKPTIVGLAAPPLPRRRLGHPGAPAGPRAGHAGARRPGAAHPRPRPTPEPRRDRRLHRRPPARGARGHGRRGGPGHLVDRRHRPHHRHAGRPAHRQGRPRLRRASRTAPRWPRASSCSPTTTASCCSSTSSRSAPRPTSPSVLGCSQMQVSRLLRKAIHRLRRHMLEP